MPTETRYFRNDQGTVHGCTAYLLLPEPTFSYRYLANSYMGNLPVTWVCWIYILHEVGGLEYFGSSTSVTKTEDYTGYITLTFNCPEKALLPSDAIYIRVVIYVGTYPNFEAFVTYPLNASKLNASTWSLILFVKRYYDPNTGLTTGSFFWGWDPYMNSRIENFSWEPYVPPPPAAAPSIIGDGLAWTTTAPPT